MDVEGIQSRLDAHAAALDNSTPEVLRELRGVDADLERIRFTVVEAEQRDAALARLKQTREAVVNAALT